MRRWVKELAVILSLLAVTPGPGQGQQTLERPGQAENLAQWLQEFARCGVTRDQLEEHLGHSLAAATSEDWRELKGLLIRVRRGDEVARRPGSATTRPGEAKALSPTAAAKLSEQVDETFATLREHLKNADEQIKKMPTRFPPDLKLEEMTIEHFLEVVRTSKRWAGDFERRSPEMLEAAANYRARLKEAMATLARGAEQDRGTGDALLAGLASTEDLIGQAYAKRLEWAEALYHDLQSQMGALKRSQVVLNRWEAVLLLMQPIAREGSITQENLRSLLQYQQALEQTMGSFRTFGEKMRAASEEDGAAPAAKTNDPTRLPGPARETVDPTKKR